MRPAAIAVTFVACALSVAGFAPSSTVGAAGTLRFAVEGALDEEELRDRLLAQLDEAPPALVSLGARSDAIDSACNALARGVSSGTAGVAGEPAEPAAEEAAEAVWLVRHCAPALGGAVRAFLGDGAALAPVECRVGAAAAPRAFALHARYLSPRWGAGWLSFAGDVAPCAAERAAHAPGARAFEARVTRAWWDKGGIEAPTWHGASDGSSGDFALRAYDTPSAGRKGPAAAPAALLALLPALPVSVAYARDGLALLAAEEQREESADDSRAATPRVDIAATRFVGDTDALFAARRDVLAGVRSSIPTAQNAVDPIDLVFGAGLGRWVRRAFFSRVGEDQRRPPDDEAR